MLMPSLSKVRDAFVQQDTLAGLPKLLLQTLSVIGTFLLLALLGAVFVTQITLFAS